VSAATWPEIAGMLLAKGVKPMVLINPLAMLLVRIQPLLREECGEVDAGLEGATLMAGRIFARAAQAGTTCEESDLLEAGDPAGHQAHRDWQAAMSTLDAAAIVVWSAERDRYIVSTECM
jgi:hypothetical protein